MNVKPVAVQLWTVRELMPADLPGALKRLAEIGFEGIELWFATWPAADELKRLVDASGLKVVGAHVQYAQLRDRLDEVARYHATVGNRDVAIPNIPAELTATPDDWKRRVEEIDRIARRCAELGLRLSYHNHFAELQQQIDGMEVLDYIAAGVPADVLKIELDTYFVQASGRDAAQYVRRYAGRLPLLHVKDPSPVNPREDVPLGQGTIDWRSVAQAADEAGVECYVVEKSHHPERAMQDLRTSYQHLRSLGAV